MPQQSLLPDHPAMSALVLEVRSWPHTASPDQVDVFLSGRSGEGPYKTRSVTSLTNLERDYLDTLATEALSAFMYGETWKDVVRAVAGVKKLARLHEAAHAF